MSYTVTYNGDDFLLLEELRRIQEAFAFLSKSSLPTIYEEPEKPREGDMAIADGTEWDPVGTGTPTPVIYLNGTWTEQNTGGGAGSVVNSFNGRTGVVVPTSGDYNAFHYTEAEVDTLLAGKSDTGHTHSSFSGTFTATRLRATATTDVSLSSTGHGFQVGPDGGVNLAMDGNEIMARNNGAVSTLNLNINGGQVAVGAGGISSAGDGTFNTSDLRLKDNLKVIPQALKKVLQISGYTYRRKDINKAGAGLIYQEVLKVLPEVTEIGPNGYGSISYGNVSGLLVQAIKELTWYFKLAVLFLSATFAMSLVALLRTL